VFANATGATGNAGNAGEIISAGNFHGMPLAIPLDSAAIAIAHLAGISERRTFWMLSAFDPESHLPPYMAKGAGLSSGLMIAQYVAAACCNEIIGLCTPASVANISTSAGIEDYNSFGPRAGWKLLRVLDLSRKVIAIEMLCACEGLEYHRPLRSGAGVEAAYARIRSKVQPLGQDRPPTPDIEAIAAMIRAG
jgi:histidine ammonia-lyase